MAEPAMLATPAPSQIWTKQLAFFATTPHSRHSVSVSSARLGKVPTVHAQSVNRVPRAWRAPRARATHANLASNQTSNQSTNPASFSVSLCTGKCPPWRYRSNWTAATLECGESLDANPPDVAAHGSRTKLPADFCFNCRSSTAIGPRLPWTVTAAGRSAVSPAFSIWLVSQVRPHPSWRASLDRGYLPALIGSICQFV